MNFELNIFELKKYINFDYFILENIINIIGLKLLQLV